MELHIRDKAIKWSWFFTILALFAWGVYDHVKSQSISIPRILFFMQFLVYFFISNITKWNVGDESGTKQIIWFAAALLLFLVVFGVILYFILGG